MNRLLRTAIISFFFCLLLSPSLLFALDDLYDAPGLDPNRETYSTMPSKTLIHMLVMGLLLATFWLAQCRTKHITT